MQYEKAYAYLMPKMEKELPAHLTYHNANHTKDVIKVALQLARAENVNGQDLEILRTAALYHDSGFLRAYDNHEEVSCDIARESLPQFGYSLEQIEKICRLIMATRIPQRPADNLESILCDADLSYLGTEHYFPVAESLFMEWKEEGKLKSWDEWEKLQLSFLEAHRFHTRSGLRFFSSKKSHNFLLFKSGVRKVQNPKSKWIQGLQDAALIILGAAFTAVGVEIFLVPAAFLDGGVTGVALILKAAFGFSLAITTFSLNFPFILASYYVAGRSFAIKGFIGILLLALFLFLLHTDTPRPPITQEKILIAFFGGFFIGIGSGLAIRAGSVLDGTEVLALYTKKVSNFTIAEIILAINALIFSVAAKVINLNAAMFSVLTYMVASRTIQYVVEGFEEFTGVTIISGNHEVLKSRLVNELKRSITVYKGERGYLPGNIGNALDCDIIFMVISRLELRKLKNLVYETDPNAFVFANTISEASGGILKNNRAH